MDELAPAYIALIRHVLCVPPGADALVQLASRLRPADPRERPPYRAPGIVRLRRALRRLEVGKAPVTALEEFSEDLRFLKLFEPDKPSMAREAMQRLLADVMGSPTEPRNERRQPPRAGETPTVVPIRRRSSKKRGGS